MHKKTQLVKESKAIVRNTMTTGVVSVGILTGATAAGTEWTANNAHRVLPGMWNMGVSTLKAGTKLLSGSFASKDTTAEMIDASVDAVFDNPLAIFDAMEAGAAQAGIDINRWTRKALADDDNSKNHYRKMTKKELEELAFENQI